MLNIDLSEVVLRIIKYMVEGLAVAAAAFYIPRRKMETKTIIMLAVTAAASLAVLDHLTPSIGDFARQGAGFGIGLSLVGTKLPYPAAPALV
jgi:hypothetical protein